jgi:ABC-type Zn2+ transport system substrate-binding protein/surface adhesin
MSDRDEDSLTSSACQRNDVALQGSVVIDFEELVKQADPKVVDNVKLFHEIGEHCSIMDKAHSDLSSIVLKLRAARVKLADFASFNVAKVYMRDKHPEVNNHHQRHHHHHQHHNHHHHHHHHHHHNPNNNQNFKRDILA